MNYLRKKRGFKERLAREHFPFVDIYWDSVTNQPRAFAERSLPKMKNPDDLLSVCFIPDGLFNGQDLADLLPLLNRLNGNKRIRVRETVLERLDGFLQEKQMAELATARHHRRFPGPAPGTLREKRELFQNNQL